MVARVRHCVTDCEGHAGTERRLGHSRNGAAILTVQEAPTVMQETLVAVFESGIFLFCHSAEMTRNYFPTEKDSCFLTENNEYKIRILV